MPPVLDAQGNDVHELYKGLSVKDTAGMLKSAPVLEKIGYSIQTTGKKAAEAMNSGQILFVDRSGDLLPLSKEHSINFINITDQIMDPDAPRLPFNFIFTVNGDGDRGNYQITPQSGSTLEEMVSAVTLGTQIVENGKIVNLDSSSPDPSRHFSENWQISEDGTSLVMSNNYLDVHHSFQHFPETLPRWLLDINATKPMKEMGALSLGAFVDTKSHSFYPLTWEVRDKFFMMSDQGANGDLARSNDYPSAFRRFYLDSQEFIADNGQKLNLIASHNIENRTSMLKELPKVMAEVSASINTEVLPGLKDVMPGWQEVQFYTFTEKLALADAFRANFPEVGKDKMTGERLSYVGLTYEQFVAAGFYSEALRLAEHAGDTANSLGENGDLRVLREIGLLMAIGDRYSEPLVINPNYKPGGDINKMFVPLLSPADKRASKTDILRVLSRTYLSLAANSTYGSRYTEVALNLNKLNKQIEYLQEKLHIHDTPFSQEFQILAMKPPAPGVENTLTPPLTEMYKQFVEENAAEIDNQTTELARKYGYQPNDEAITAFLKSERITQITDEGYEQIKADPVITEGKITREQYAAIYLYGLAIRLARNGISGNLQDPGNLPKLHLILAAADRLSSESKLNYDTRFSRMLALATGYWENDEHDDELKIAYGHVRTNILSYAVTALKDNPNYAEHLILRIGFQPVNS